jgi:serine/threonine-protein kinase HipA
MQSLGAIAHLDFNNPIAHSYEQAVTVIRRLGLSMDAVEEQFRRMVFNVIARNQDDHVKNIAFLMDKRGQWSLAPAFDVMYAYNPSGTWTASHQMSLAGKREGFTLEDLKAVADTASMKRGRAEVIAREVAKAVSGWREFAAMAGVASKQIDMIADVHRLDLV